MIFDRYRQIFTSPFLTRTAVPKTQNDQFYGQFRLAVQIHFFSACAMLCLKYDDRLWRFLNVGSAKAKVWMG